MSRNCPICERRPLAPTAVQGVEIETCPGCKGLWFDAGKLKRFADRPSTGELLPLAQHAPGRCKRHGHPVSQALVRCAVCGAAPAECPSCHLRLAMVPTRVCAVDICLGCQGIWLDAGELEALKGAVGVSAAPLQETRSTHGGWEIPEPSAPAKDPWLAPGQVQAPQRAAEIPNVRTPFNCRQCGAALALAQAWAYDGEIYCVQCHPPGAVSSGELPSDQPADEERPRLGRALMRLLFGLRNND